VFDFPKAAPGISERDYQTAQHAGVISVEFNICYNAGHAKGYQECSPVPQQVSLPEGKKVLASLTTRAGSTSYHGNQGALNKAFVTGPLVCTLQILYQTSSWLLLHGVLDPQNPSHAPFLRGHSTQAPVRIKHEVRERRSLPDQPREVAICDLTGDDAVWTAKRVKVQPVEVDEPTTAQDSLEQL